MIAKFKTTAIKLITAAMTLTLLAGCSGASNPAQSSAPAQSQQDTAATSQAGGNTSASVPAGSNSIVYKNNQYGFSFTLPGSWEGYSIVNSEWQGTSVQGESSGTVAQNGPMISIRHPKWTSEPPRQDIPIMIFTIDQWNSLQQEKFHIGAAPVNPSELGRNNVYVFALPARYNFAFPQGFEEVEEILKGSPLKTTQVTQQSTDDAKPLLTNMMSLAKQGKIINCDFSAKTNTIDEVEKVWGKADKVDYVEAADGSYYTYTNHNVVFGVNKGAQIFEVRSFDSILKGITLSEVKKVLGTPPHDVKNNGQEFIGYAASPDFKLEMVFPEPTGSNPDPMIDHYNVLYPAGTVNSMKGDPGRQW